ncbi:MULTISPECIES: aminotransferase class I/II-fold pyridoxal phosphate-dependent enzyme [unclassified Acidovorax]|uniref:aminotransferase class I/II-fold pyridoxal phosphate-dependent enzyme n=1 Tax=unclassified Acidovorax TaxID=2684926 RepID=UPI0028834E4D|nr:MULTISPECIES: aminotransferase class I/II-fold pyridoxal phosphate-dependent enzyme [unclassified Acidovorax]
MTTPEHGGPDALGVPLHDFSTNANACGPCPQALAALQGADATQYPDPAYTALRERLGAFHGVAPARIVIAASASEFIHRITALAAQRGARAVALPAHSYGDYERAAQAWALGVVRAGQGDNAAADAALHWACEPSSPLGRADPALDAGRTVPFAALQVIDCAYAPLRLEGAPRAGPPGAWQLWTPNKALGLTGVRAAYAIAPEGDAAQGDIAMLSQLAPSWPLGAHGVALLQAWTEPATQHWLAGTLNTLREWKAAQTTLCTSLGWTVLPGSLANYFSARLPERAARDMLNALRGHGIKLRDCASFGLPGHVRLGVLGPAAQVALRQACKPEKE